MKDHKKYGSKWNRGPSKWYKRFAAQKHRSWIKQKIDNGKFDDFFDKEYRMFANPWEWD